MFTATVFIVLLSLVCLGTHAQRNLMDIQGDSLAVQSGCGTKCQKGCCELRDAVCCSDEENCCPSGFTCNQQADGCTSSYYADSIGMQHRFIPATKIQKAHD